MVEHKDLVVVLKLPSVSGMHAMEGKADDDAPRTVARR